MFQPVSALGGPRPQTPRLPTGKRLSSMVAPSLNYSMDVPEPWYTMLSPERAAKRRVFLTLSGVSGTSLELAILKLKFQLEDLSYPTDLRCLLFALAFSQSWSKTWFAWLVDLCGFKVKAIKVNGEPEREGCRMWAMWANPSTESAYVIGRSRSSSADLHGISRLLI